MADEAVNAASMGSFLNTDRDGNAYSKDSGSGAMTNELL
jgi:hypothetical protein